MRSKLNPDYLKWIAKKENQVVFSVQKTIAQQSHSWINDSAAFVVTEKPQLYTYAEAVYIASLLSARVCLSGKVKIELWRLG